MKYLKLIAVCCFSAMLFSCKDDDAQRRAETIRTEKQNDSILKVISENWRFNVPPVNDKVAARISGWNEWEQFHNELMQKPTGSLNAYRQKTKTLVTRAEQLNLNIPGFFNKPQVRSRIAVLNTKIKSLYTYINIAVIPDKKVVTLIKEITHETTSLQNQMSELIILSEIPKEIGEEEMLKALDTTRMANPEMQAQPQPSSTPKPQMRSFVPRPGASQNN
ncbi:MAG: hypothetical protein DI539_01960 [Flavobacterium psychrophilum]|nr:MAG: hypothetical protein DI539_01960 [Flavobacterium psychrophilum]